MVNRLRGCATYGTSTSPKMRAYVSATGYGHTLVEEQSKSKVKVKGGFVPVYVALGMILLQASLALHIAKQHLMYSPSVRVKKKLRETMPEVDYPDKVVDDAYKFTGNSFFRKAAHIHEFESGFQSTPDPIRKDVYAHTPQAVTLKSVGIDPSTQH